MVAFHQIRVYFADRRAASVMTSATSSGLDAKTAWLPAISVTALPARFAMSRSRSGLIDLSCVATIDQLFFVFQAGSSALAAKAALAAKT